MIKKIRNFILRRPWLKYIVLMCIPDIAVSINIKEIGKFRIRLRRNRSFWLRDPLSHERYTMSALSHMCEEKDVVYDIGANIGLHTRFCIQEFGAKKVVAFEPMESNVKQLINNVEYTGINEKVKIYSLAISDEEGKKKLQIDDMQSGTASLDKIKEGDPSEGRDNLNLDSKTEIVESKTLDALLSEESLPPPDLIKIDIEGAEMLALQGAKKTLSTHSPTLIIETHGAEVARETISFLFSMDYRIAANVQGNLRKSDEWHRRLRPADIPLIQRKYDVRFVIATPAERELPSSLQLYSDRE